MQMNLLNKFLLKIKLYRSKISIGIRDIMYTKYTEYRLNRKLSRLREEEFWSKFSSDSEFVKLRIKYTVIYPVLLYSLLFILGVIFIIYLYTKYIG
jgi:hypothetical protein